MIVLGLEIVGAFVVIVVLAAVAGFALESFVRSVRGPYGW